MNQEISDGEMMTTAGGQQTSELLDRILESAVVLNWKDLTQNPKAGLIHVEYHIGVERSIDYLRVWSSTVRGYWSLVCHCSVGPDSSSTLRFGNGHRPRELGTSLEAIMTHQGTFPHDCAANTDHLLQVGPPSVEETAAAKLRIEKAFGSVLNLT